MRTLAFLLVSLAAVGAQEVEWPELRGIVHLDGANKPAAVLVVPKPTTTSKIRTAPGPRHSTILFTGEIDAAPGGGTEVVGIDAAAGTVQRRRRTSSEATTLKLAGLTKGESYLLHLERVPLSIAFECYQRLSGRTVIYSPQFPAVELDVHVPAGQDKTHALAALAKAIEPHEVVIIDHGEKFAFAVSTRHKQLVASLPLPPQGGPAPPAAAGHIIPAGLIKFAAADGLQVIDFYSDLSGRTVLRPNHLLHAPITLRSQTSLSRDEAIWMVEAALRLCRLTTLPAGDKFVYVVPPERARNLPAFDPARKIAGTPGAIKLVEVDPGHLLETYAALTGRKARPLDPKLPHAKITFRSQAPLPPAEAAFALEAVAILNGLALQPIGQNEIALVPLALAEPKTN